MPLIDKIREDKLIELAKARFDPDLKPAELKVLHDSASSEDLPEPDEKAPRPEVRAAFIRWLATDPEAVPHIDPRGIRVFATTITGQLNLRECHIDSTLVFRRCDFQGKINLQSAEAKCLFFLNSSLAGGIHADWVIVHGTLFLRNIHAESEIRLLGAQIEGNLECSGAKLKTEGNALSADGAKIDGDVFLRDGFESDGAIRLLSADIKGQLNCTGAKLKSEGNALYADGVKIGCDIFMMDGFEIGGTIRLLGAEVGGDLTVFGAKVSRAICQNTVVKGDMIWQCIEKSEDTYLNLIGMRVKNLRDDRMSWPDEEHLDIDGLVYEELTLHETSSDENIKAGLYPHELPLVAEERIAWIMLQPPERRTEPQPWMQLRDLLERKGDRKGAKHVLYKLRCLQVKNEWFLRQKLSIAFAWLEESLIRILCPIAITLLLGTLIFYRADQGSKMLRTDNKVTEVSYPPFQPFVYTLENTVPLAKLGMDDKWAPNPATDWYWFLAVSRWLLIFIGWFYSAVLGAALLRRFKE